MLRRLVLLLAVPVLGAVLPVSGRAQEDSEVTEEMKELCPRLAAAEGRLREQLILLYFRLDPARAGDPEQQALVREKFDLARAEDGALLQAELFDAAKPRCLGGMKAALAGLGAPGALFCVREFAVEEPRRRARALEGLQGCEFAEVYALLLHALQDKAFLDEADAQIAPPGYEPKRVADHAFRVLAAKLDGTVKVPKGLLSGAGVGPMVPVPDRDTRIAALVDWAAADAAYAEHVKSRPALLAALPPAEAEAARAALEKAGVKPAK
jgi:hypothetical protein